MKRPDSRYPLVYTVCSESTGETNHCDIYIGIKSFKIDNKALVLYNTKS